MGSPASCQLVIEVSVLNPETITTVAVRNALKAHLGSTKSVRHHCLQRGQEYVPCFEAVWRAFAGDHTGVAAGDNGSGVRAPTLRSHCADGSLFSPL